MNSSAYNGTCGICFRTTIGAGQAIFTAECSHVFHYHCITNYRTNNCIVCGVRWNILPSTYGFGNAPYQRSSPYNLPQFTSTINRNPAVEPEPTRFSDDEALPSATTNTSSMGIQNATIKAIPERPALAASEYLPQFSVLVGIKAPLLSDDMQRSPIDLVTVLDVSGSMCGAKLDLVKRAIYFVIDNLGSSDRLSVVSFSDQARRVLRLTRMTQHGCELAKQAVASLFVNGGTNIVEGLKKGARVLEERHHKNPVASIIFLSDGNDTFNHGPSLHSPFSNRGRAPPQYINLLPASICPRNSQFQEQQTFPVHAFGFGSDHDPIAMHAIADASNGTFSFIESFEMVQDAFANCIGGLLSVVMQELRVSVKAASHGVEIKSIPSGRYVSTISNQGSEGTIGVGDLYAEEDREFLINLSVPRLLTNIAESNEESETKTSLLDITCSYRDVVSKGTVQIEADLVEIRRPKFVSPEDLVVNLEVDRQRNRLLVAESIAEAQRMAESGNLVQARALLSDRRSALFGSAAGQAGDGMCGWLEAELKETEERMRNMQIYEQSGRAYTLAGMSSHAGQRATTRGNMVPGAMLLGGAAGGAVYGGGGHQLQQAYGGGVMVGCARDGGALGGAAMCPPPGAAFGGYATPFMAMMVNKSQQLNNDKAETTTSVTTQMKE